MTEAKKRFVHLNKLINIGSKFNNSQLSTKDKKIYKIKL